MRISDRYHQLTAQRRYTREVAARGLSALLAPYGPRVPAQRRDPRWP